jgi:hypothetical protein
VDDLDSLNTPTGIAGHDDMPPPRQDARQAVEGLAAHDHRAAHGQPLEPLEVTRDMPWKVIILADYAVDGAG